MHAATLCCIPVCKISAHNRKRPFYCGKAGLWEAGSFSPCTVLPVFEAALLLKVVPVTFVFFMLLVLPILLEQKLNLKSQVAF